MIYGHIGGQPALNTPAPPTEHLQTAEEMAKTIMAMFSIEQQNEVVEHILTVIRETRNGERVELLERVKVLEVGLQGLPSPITLPVKQ